MHKMAQTILLGIMGNHCFSGGFGCWWVEGWIANLFGDIVCHVSNHSYGILPQNERPENRLKPLLFFNKKTTCSYPLRPYSSIGAKRDIGMAFADTHSDCPHAPSHTGFVLSSCRHRPPRAAFRLPLSPSYCIYLPLSVPEWPMNPVTLFVCCVCVCVCVCACVSQHIPRGGNKEVPQKRHRLAHKRRDGLPPPHALPCRENSQGTWALHKHYPPFSAASRPTPVVCFPGSDGSSRKERLIPKKSTKTTTHIPGDKEEKKIVESKRELFENYVMEPVCHFDRNIFTPSHCHAPHHKFTKTGGEQAIFGTYQVGSQPRFAAFCEKSHNFTKV